MTTQTLDTGIALSASLAEFVAEDRWIVAGEAVDLADEELTCSCGEAGCAHAVAAMVAQARMNKRAA
jgi:hypothetical protein